MPFIIREGILGISILSPYSNINSMARISKANSKSQWDFQPVLSASPISS
jgi:hypothetical protein